MQRMKMIAVVIMALVLGTALHNVTMAQDIDVLVTPDEAEIDLGESLKIDVFAFSLAAQRSPVDIANVTWTVSPDSMGTITDDGFFIAGKYEGRVEIVAAIIVGNVRFDRRVIVVIRRRAIVPVLDVAIDPHIAVVPTGTEKQFDVVVKGPRGRSAGPNHVRWDVNPENLGKIDDQGLFVAGDQVRHGKVIALVEIDGLTIRAAAKVVISAPATGAIAGTVTNDNGNAPIEGAVVKAIRLGRIPWAQKADTDANGDYLLGDLIPGFYVIHGNARGLIAEFYDNTRDYLQATPVLIAEADTTTDVNIGLSEGGKIAGTVVTKENIPLLNAHVVAFLSVNPRRARHTVTDDNGDYTIDGLPSGSYVAAANIDGYKSEFFDDAHRLADVTLIDLAEPAVIDTVDFELDPASAMVGKVTDSDGTPIAGAHVRVFRPRSTSVNAFRYRAFRETRTNDAGEYLVQTRPGEYLVFASAQDFDGEYYQDAQTMTEATPVEVFADSHTVDINFELDKRGSIAGRVTDQATGLPVEGAIVEAHNENARQHAAISVRGGLRAKTDANGDYLIERVPSGSYLLVAVDREHQPEYYQESASKDAATLVDVKNTDEVDKNFTLEAGGSISGVVASAVDSAGIARARVQVWQRNSRRHHRATYTDENGAYALSGLPSGDYYVQVIADKFFPAFHDNVDRPSEATPVAVNSPDETAEVNFFLKPFERKRGTLAGHVVSDEDESPLHGAIVIAVRFRSRRPFIAYTGPRGHYELTDVPAGKYYVIAFADGFAAEFFKDAHRFKNAEPVFVESDQVTGGVDFGLRPQDRRGVYAIRGRILARDTNEPLEGVSIHARVDGEIDVSSVTDANGNYAIDGLIAGDYKIEASGVGFEDGHFGGADPNTAQSVAVGNGADAEQINLNLTVDGVTDVEVNDDLTGLPKTFDLSQNYPNPFNPETTIKYQLPENSLLTLKVFNILGQEIRTLVNKQQPAGAYSVTWDGKDDLGRQVASGLYIFQINAGDSFTKSRRTLLLK